MASNLPINPKFTWGDEVKVKNFAPNKYEPGEIGEVCGFSQIESEITAKKHQVLMGTFIYTIEFADGHDIQIPEEFLEKYSVKG